MKSFAFVFVILPSLALAAVNYCDKSLCKGKVHIGCSNNGKIHSSCAATSEFIDLSSLKDDIVHLHNEKRNKVASGKEGNYKPAERMATMTWDNELAFLAGLNVKTCEFDHDACRNTPDFKYSGQNIAYWSGYPAISIKEAIGDAVEGWYGEHVNANMGVIKKYQASSDPEKPNGHFTVMVADRNTKVGCGMLKTVEGKMTTYVMTCNYATTNMRDHPIYKEGKAPADGCQSGRNPKYPALCSVSEKYDVNKF